LEATNLEIKVLSESEIRNIDNAKKNQNQESGYENRTKKIASYKRLAAQTNPNSIYYNDPKYLEGGDPFTKNLEDFTEKFENGSLFESEEEAKKFWEKQNKAELEIQEGAKYPQEGEKDKGLNFNIRIKNNTEEVIEDCYLTVRIVFKFKNKQYDYLKPYNLLNNDKTWMPNKSLIFDLYDIITLAVGNTKVLNIHKPKSVELEFYITAQNSIGYNNMEKNTKELRTSGFYSGSEFSYGKFTDERLSENQIFGLGKKILDKDITDLWNKL